MLIIWVKAYTSLFQPSPCIDNKDRTETQETKTRSTEALQYNQNTSMQHRDLISTEYKAVEAKTFISAVKEANKMEFLHKKAIKHHRRDKTQSDLFYSYRQKVGSFPFFPRICASSVVMFSAGRACKRHLRTVQK